MSQAVRSSSTSVPDRGPQPNTNSNRDRYFEPSPTGGFVVGRLPGSIDLSDLCDLHHPESPIRAIRAKCVDCSGGVSAEARKCVTVGCPLWPFQMAGNPFRMPASEAKRAATANATAAARMARAAQNERSSRSFLKEPGPTATTPIPTLIT